MYIDAIPYHTLFESNWTMKSNIGGETGWIVCNMLRYFGLGQYILQTADVRTTDVFSLICSKVIHSLQLVVV